ncbi:MAG: hypothetical protein ACPL7J_06850 [Desulfomonilaceae bacterium]
MSQHPLDIALLQAFGYPKGYDSAPLLNDHCTIVYVIPSRKGIVEVRRQ